MIKIILYLILLASIHAKLEQMIEGKTEGWASNLPCWKIENKIIKFLFGKSLTGYHYWLFIMFLLLFHSPLLFINWSFKIESLILGFYFLYWVCEDYLWFLENFYYGIRNFKKGRISWHVRWWLKLPVSYWILGSIGTTLLLLGK
jgi:hypothetical protein